MKKFLLKIVSLLIVCVLSFGFLNGCELVTTNVERDMAQVIATVSIDDDFSDKIYKRDLQASFNENAYYYVNYYGYTKSETYEMLLDEMIENKIIVQYSLKALTEKTDDAHSLGYLDMAKNVNESERTSIEKVLTTPVYGQDGKFETAPSDLSKTDKIISFLTKYEYEKARYNVLYQIDNMLKTYIEEDEEDEHNHDAYEQFTFTKRTTLTIEQAGSGNEYERKYDEKLSVINEDTIKQTNKVKKDFDLDINVEGYSNLYDLEMDLFTKFNAKFEENVKSNKKYQSAIRKYVKDLKEVGFISSSEASKKISDINDLLNLTYSKKQLNSQYESLIVNKFKLALENEQEKLINEIEDNGNSALYNEYATLYNSQKSNYDNNYSAYEEALANASSTNFVVYHPNYGKGNYGYVSNLLIGFSEAQSNLLASKKAEENVSQSEINALRSTLLNNLIVKDQRATWVLSNLGEFDKNSGTFTFDDKYVKTQSNEYLSKYQGTIEGVVEYTYHDEYDNEQTGYNYKRVRATEIPFNTFWENGVCKVMGISNSYEGILQGQSGETITDKDMEKFRDLIYAYSTDDGSLKENYGYVYSPITSKTNYQIQGTYVDEFSAKAEQLINGGVGSYAVVATDFGYHIMLCTKIITPTSSKLTATEFKEQITAKQGIAYEYRQYRVNAITSSLINNITKSFINENLKNGVDYNKSAYEDLITE